MPARPPVNMGMYDPTSERYRDPSKMQLVKTISKAEEEMSKTAREVELRLHSSGEILRLPAQVCTTVWDIKLFLADRLGRDPGDFTFIAKQGPFWRENKDCEEMRPKVVVKGLKSFERERMVHEHPIVVIGAGHIGLRQAMVFMKYKESNFVIFDRKEKVGGMAWWDQANVTSKLQTEYGVYHLGWDETIPTPTDDYPWPSRDELLKMFQKGAEEYGIIPYCRLGTEVKEVKAEGQKLDMKYEVVIEKIGSNKEETMKAAGVMMYPGNLSLPRRETYKGEEDFGGTIAYGMFDEFSYKEAQGKDIAIIGHGAFAVENVRSCCEYDSHQIYLICRRKNIACPRFVSWLCNQSLSPLSASLFLHAMKPMYDLVGYDVWDYYGVQGNASRTTCNIQQKARFGIGDVYFCAISWGKLEVIEDPEGVKRLGHHALYLGGSGRKLDVQCILKLLGFVGDPSNDRVMKIKELVGFWVNDDPRRYVVAEPVSVMATNFGGTSFSPGAISWAEQGFHFMEYPKDFYERVLPTGMLPRHKADETDPGTYRPAYVVDARHGTQTSVFIGSFIPWIQERGMTHSRIKVQRMWALHPIDKFLDYAREDWDHYCEKFRFEGRNGPDFPYTHEIGRHYLNRYRDENKASMKEGGELLDYYESLAAPK